MRLNLVPRMGLDVVSTSLDPVERPRGARRHPRPQVLDSPHEPGDVWDMPARGRVRVLLADSDVLMREGLRRILEGEGFEVVATASDADQLDRLVHELRPRLVITEVSLSGSEGDALDAVLRLRRESAATAVLVLSAIADVSRGVELLASGPGVGYLLRHRVTDIHRFMLDLRRVVGGGVVVEPALLEEFITTRQTGEPLRVLSPREREVLTLVAQGHSNAHVAERLWITRDTVEKHIQSIFFKLGIPEDDHFHRRVVAVLTYLEATGAPPIAADGDVA